MSFINFIKYRMKFLIISAILFVILFVVFIDVYIWGDIYGDQVAIIFIALFLGITLFNVELIKFNNHYKYFENYVEAHKYYQLKIENEKKKKQEFNSKQRDIIMSHILEDKIKK